MGFTGSHSETATLRGYMPSLLFRHIPSRRVDFEKVRESETADPQHPHTTRETNKGCSETPQRVRKLPVTSLTFMVSQNPTVQSLSERSASVYLPPAPFFYFALVES